MALRSLLGFGIVAAALLVFAFDGALNEPIAAEPQPPAASPPIFIRMTSAEAYDRIYLGNHAITQIRPPLQQVPHTAKVEVVGHQRTFIRLRPDAERLKAHGLTNEKLTSLLAEQSIELVKEGEPGAAARDRAVGYELRGRDVRGTPEFFETLILAVNSAGTVTRLRDVARLESATALPDRVITVDGDQAVGLFVTRRADASDEDFRAAVQAKMRELRKGFPPDIDYEIIDDPKRLSEKPAASPAATAVPTPAAVSNPHN